MIQWCATAAAGFMPPGSCGDGHDVPAVQRKLAGVGAGIEWDCAHDVSVYCYFL
jgi:hypothetical protein